MQQVFGLLLLISIVILPFKALANDTKTQSTSAQQSKYHSVKVSPDGKHLGVTMDVEGKKTLAFLNLESMEWVGGAKLPRLSEVGEFHWANNERVIIKVMKKEAWREEAIYYGELFAQNIDGTKAQMVYGYRSLYERKALGAGSKFKKKERTDGTAHIIDLLPSDDRNILISSTLWPENSRPWETRWKDYGKRLAAVYKLDIYNAKFSKKRIAGGPVPYSTFLTDNKGELKVAFGKNIQSELYSMQGDGWQHVPSSVFGSQVKPVAINEAGTHLITLDDKDGKLNLYQLNLSDNSYQPLTKDNVNLVSVEKTKNTSQVYAAKLSGDKVNYLMLNESSVEAQVFKNLLAVFPEKSVSITSYNGAGNLFVVKVTSAENMTKYYIYNKTTNKLSAFG